MLSLGVRPSTLCDVGNVRKICVLFNIRIANSRFRYVEKANSQLRVMYFIFMLKTLFTYLLGNLSWTHQSGSALKFSCEK